MTLTEFMYSINLNGLKLIPPQIFWLVVGLLALFVLYFMRQSYKHLKHARVLEDTPTAKIRSAAQGYVELMGEQHSFGNHVTLTRLSRIPCTWYRYAIEYYDRKNGWQLLEQGASTHLLILQDDTGLCVIDPSQANISTPMVDHWQGFSRYPNKKPSSWFGRLWGAIGNYRYTEWTMHDGMPLHAMGNFHTFTTEAFVQLYPDACQGLTLDETIHLLSKEGLDKQSPFILSAYEESKSIRKHRIDSFLWFLAYLILLASLAVMVMIRIH